MLLNAVTCMHMRKFENASVDAAAGNLTDYRAAERGSSKTEGALYRMNNGCRNCASSDNATGTRHIPSSR